MVQWKGVFPHVRRSLKRQSIDLRWNRPGHLDPVIKAGYPWGYLAGERRGENHGPRAEEKQRL